VAARESGWGRELVAVVTVVVVIIVAVMDDVLDWWKTVRGAGRRGELAQLRPGRRLLLLLLLLVLLVLMVLAVVVFVYDLTRQRVAVCGRGRSTETGEGLV